MSIVLALLGALCYGTADFAGGLASRRASALAVVFCGQLASAVVLAVVLVVVPGRFDVPSIAWGAAAGLTGAVALLLFYRSLAVGAMTVVAPVTAVMSAIVPVVGGVALGERPAPLALVGVVLAVLAVLLVSAEEGRLPGPQAIRGPGVLGALAAGTGFGLLFVLLSRAAPDSGFWPIAGARTASLLLLGVVALLARRSLVPRGAPPALVVASGVGDMTANLLFVLASRLGLLSVVGVLLALYPAATVLLAVVVLKERLHRLQLTGLAVASAGVVLIAVA
ncbi:EamA family transporter [uncultured Amnibacterium sp.]|uniref:EamA family transporter n=1 Tax=uncultured Amnibacterium sp. TaxID=1631851 RepID=UPI0035CC9574